MAIVVCVCNQKGGVGKSVTSIALSSGLAHRGYRVLGIDIDSQAHFSSVFERTNKATIVDVLSGKVDIMNALNHVPNFDKFDMLMSDFSLQKFENVLTRKDRGYAFLNIAIQDILDQYDYIIIDSPGSLGTLTYTALVASDTCVVPVQPEGFSYSTTENLAKVLRDVRINYNTRLTISGVLVTLVDKRYSLHKRIKKDIEELFPKSDIFKQSIPKTAKLAERALYERSRLRRLDEGIRAYEKFIDEFIERTKPTMAKASIR
jgi:chromosome partitioning protein